MKSVVTHLSYFLKIKIAELFTEFSSFTRMPTTKNMKQIFQFTVSRKCLYIINKQDIVDFVKFAKTILVHIEIWIMMWRKC